MQVVVEGMEPAHVATERGVSQPLLTEQLREAVGALAARYELLAYGCLNQPPAVSLRAALAGKRG